MIQKLKSIFSSRAAWFYVTIWVLSLVYLVIRGDGVTGSVAFAAGIFLFCGLTVALTRDVPDDDTEEKPAPGIRDWVQLLIVLFVVALTGYGGYVFNMWHGISAPIPLWTPVIDWFGELGGRYLGDVVDHSPGLAAANLARYVLIPLVFLLIAGARFSELGFRRGYGVWRVLALWVFIPLLFFIYGVVSGSSTVPTLLRMFVGNLLRNGFSEEFLFRGALQTRLRLFMNTDWAVVIQALLFGIWHLGVNTEMMGRDILAGLALGIASHSIFGLAMGIIFQRTRNLVAPSIVHVANNMFSS